MTLIAVLPGDGIGPEVTAEAMRVLKQVCGDRLSFEEGLVGGSAYKAKGHPLPPETLELAKRAERFFSALSVIRIAILSSALCARSRRSLVCARS